MLIPEKLQNMKPYDPSEDIYRIKLDANESPFPPNAEISQEIASAAFAGKLKPLSGSQIGNRLSKSR